MTTNRPWSEIGIDVSDHINVKQALIDAGLDFTVEVKQGYFKESKSHLCEAEGYHYIVRTDVNKVLGQCKSRFKPLQNDMLVDIAQPMIDSNEAILDTIGTFGDGEKIWILLKLANYSFTVTERDSLDHYLLLVNGHDGNTSIQVGVVPIRVWCANMFPMIGKHMIKFKHTETAEEMLKFFKGQIEKRLARVPEDVKNLALLAKSSCSVTEAEIYFKRVLGMSVKEELSTRSKNTIARLVELFEHGQGNYGLTWYDAFNAVTEYLNYEIGRNQGTRLNSLWFGTNSNTGDRALRLALGEIK